MKEQSLDDAQGSVQHLQEAAVVIAMRQIDGYPLPDKEATLLQFKALKIRQHRRAGDSAYVIARLGRVSITDQIVAEQDVKNVFGENNEDSETKDTNNPQWKTKF